MEPLADPPWETLQFIPFQGPLPRNTLLQEGWKEMSHSEITEVKEKLKNIESQDIWEIYKKITNPYEAIFSGSSEIPFPSLAQVMPLSRSYFKMIEMLNLLNFWPKEKILKHPIRSAHVCEGPGGFIQATVEGVCERGLEIDAVYAMTLKPTKTHIPGWRRSIKFLRKYPQIHLEYGADDTGNILSLENQRSFVSRAEGSTLFTADGGFDFSIDYLKQEESSFPLILASFSIGLRCLVKGGFMIIKLFDMYSEATQDLILGTARLFKEFTIYKPATSRPCNSERYFMAKGYVGVQTAQPWIHHLQRCQVAHQQSPLTRLTTETWNSAIQEAIQEQIAWQEEVQIQTIRETLNLDRKTLAARIDIALQKSRKWCERFKVPFRMDG